MLSQPSCSATIWMFAKIRTCKEIDAMKRVLLATLLFCIGVLASMGIYPVIRTSRAAHPEPWSQSPSTSSGVMGARTAPRPSPSWPRWSRSTRVSPYARTKSGMMLPIATSSCKMAAKYGFEPTAVPTIFIGDQILGRLCRRALRTRNRRSRKVLCTGRLSRCRRGRDRAAAGADRCQPARHSRRRWWPIANAADVTAPAAIIAPASSVISGAFPRRDRSGRAVATS
jgi:hypothetical protein